ncbi:hypothetical protein SEA_GINGERBUG_62 [Microbacterium phage Gingerbug]|nr:hypothetical protein SEA_GINGERBUG_62 [Microbacterium phage Gingerbug]
MSVYRNDLTDAIEHGLQTPVCQSTDEGWLCTLVKGHEGPEHAAGVGQNLYAHLWPVAPAELHSEAPARDVFCPNCQARPGYPCTQPTNTGRREVKRHHRARVIAATEARDGR